MGNIWLSGKVESIGIVHFHSVVGVACLRIICKIDESALRFERLDDIGSLSHRLIGDVHSTHFTVFTIIIIIIICEL